MTPAGKGERRYLSPSPCRGLALRACTGVSGGVSRGAKFHLGCQGFQRDLRIKLTGDELTGEKHTHSFTVSFT